MTERFEDARRVADAVLYEGYILYPYRASSQKNQTRWQFGVLMPKRWGEATGSEPWCSQTECLLEAHDDAVVHIRVRFLHIQQRGVMATSDGEFVPVESLDVDGVLHASFDESVEREVDVVVPLAELLNGSKTHPFAFDAWSEEEPLHTAAGVRVGSVIRRRCSINGAIRISAESIEGPYGLVKLRVRIENETPHEDLNASRSEALRSAFVAAHAFIAATRAAFVSLLEPPQWAKPATQLCVNERTWPVLIGEGRNDLVLSSPIILYDYPTIAPESSGDLFDATEIDEILLLRTLTLTDEEKKEARATDPRAAAIIDRVDAMHIEELQQLHGTLRGVRELRTDADPFANELTPWWDPGADASVSPETDHIVIAGKPVMRGSRVRLMPKETGTDAQDLFLRGRTAIVEAVFFDVDGNSHLAVLLEDDPAADLQAQQGRFLYFKPEEIEPLEVLA